MSDGSNRQVKAYNLHKLLGHTVESHSDTINLCLIDHQGKRTNIMLNPREAARIEAALFDFTNLER